MTKGDPQDCAGGEAFREDGKPSLEAMCRSGFWFCEGCKRVTMVVGLNAEGQVGRCVKCRSAYVTFVPPATGLLDAGCVVVGKESKV